MITSYPDKNSLKEALSTELSITTLKYMCRKNGVFLLSNKKEDIINAVHLFYWGFSDINRMAQLMEDSKNYKKSFRLEVEKNRDLTTDEENDLFRDFFTLVSSHRAGIALQKGISFESFVIEQQNNQPHLKAIVEYKRKRKGRVKLMDEVVQRFSFDAFEENDKIIVDIVFDDRNSVQVAKSIIKESVANSEEFRLPKQISLKTLTTSERVDLFDRFFAYRFDNWMIDAVRNIKVQMPDGIPVDDEEAEEMENNFLTGIESALFSGSGLRTNPIVMDAVSRGYFFPKASVMFDHRIDALKLLLDIAFNSDELLLELSISSTYEIEEDRHYKHPIPPEDQETALQYFHSVLAEIYAQILNERETE